MAKFGEENLPELGFIPTQKQVVQPMDYSQLAKGVGMLGVAAVEARNKAKQDEQAGLVESFAQDLEDTTRSSIHHGFIQGPEPTSDTGITAGDQAVLNEAKASAQELASLREQGMSPTLTALKRDQLFKEYLARYPQLAPELRDTFQKTTGKTVLKTLMDIEENQAEQARKAEDEQKKYYIERAQALHVYNPTDSHEQLVAKVLPYETELRELQDMDNQLKALQGRREIGHEQRRAVQEQVFRRGISGYVLATNLELEKLYAETNFDPETANAETRTALLQTIQQHQQANEAELRQAGSDLDSDYVNSRWQIIKTQYDNAINYVSGKVTKEAYQSSNTIRLAASEARLLNVPGMADKLTILDKYKGLHPDLLLPQHKAKAGTEIIFPIAQALLNTAQDGEANVYAQMQGMANPSGKVQIYENFAEIAKQNLDNPDVQDALVNNLEAFSNQFDQDPTKVETGVLDKFLDISAQPGFIDVQKRGAFLPANTASAMKEYSTRLQESMAKDMSQIFNERVEIPGKSRTPADEAFLNFITLGGLIDRETLGISKATEAPKMIELVTPTLQTDGSILFKPKDQVSKNVRVRQLVRELNQKYSQPFGRLARSYAHTVQGNMDYNTAAQTIFTGTSFSEVQQVQPTGSGAVTQETPK